MGQARCLYLNQVKERMKEMINRPLECCCQCHESTGRGRQDEDSLYTESGNLGPYCENCWDDAEYWREYADELFSIDKRKTI